MSDLRIAPSAGAAPYAGRAKVAPFARAAQAAETKAMSEKWLQAIFPVDQRAPYSCKSLQLRPPQCRDGRM